MGPVGRSADSQSPNTVIETQRGGERVTKEVFCSWPLLGLGRLSARLIARGS